MYKKMETTMLIWAAVQELHLRYFIGQTILITIYSHYGSLI